MVCLVVEGVFIVFGGYCGVGFEVVWGFIFDIYCLNIIIRKSCSYIFGSLRVDVVIERDFDSFIRGVWIVVGGVWLSNFIVLVYLM